MKKLILVSALGLAGLSSLPVQAQVASSNFDVSVSLTSKCRVATGAGTALSFGTYVAFQTGAQTEVAPVGITFECTRGYAATPAVSFDTTNGTAAGVGVLAGLQYSLTATAGATAAGTAPTTSALGTPATYAYSVTGSMPAGQAGSDSSGIQTHVRTLVFAY